MIPKVIHYCWFSNDPFPVEIKLCMDTWKKVLPDFTLRIWKMADALSLNCDYVNEALQSKKWAFAADVVRIYALYSEGGVYMDSDIYLKNRFDQFMIGDFVSFHECKIDSFLQESYSNGIPPFGIQAAFIIGRKGNLFCKIILDYYYSHHFLNKDGSMNMYIAPLIYVQIAEQLGFKYINKKQELANNTIIFDSKYLAQTKRDVGSETFGVHRISHSWKNKSEYSLSRRIEKKIKHYFLVCKYHLFHS